MWGIHEVSGFISRILEDSFHNFVLSLQYLYLRVSLCTLGNLDQTLSTLGFVLGLEFS